MSDFFERTAAALAFSGTAIGAAEREARERLEAVAIKAEKDAGIDKLQATMEKIPEGGSPDAATLAAAKKYNEALRVIQDREEERASGKVAWRPPVAPEQPRQPSPEKLAAEKRHAEELRQIEERAALPGPKAATVPVTFSLEEAPPKDKDAETAASESKKKK